ncbi:hypothetical protein [Streptomyces sp. NPDC056883]
MSSKKTGIGHLLADPQHPCTRLLLESVPRPGRDPGSIAAARRAL